MDEERLKHAFGTELRKARKAVGISQEKLALKVGLDRSYISILERGLFQPSLKTIFLLSPELGLSNAEFIDRVESRLNKTSSIR